MPRAITHYLFAMDCFNNLDKNTQNIIKENMSIYTFGSQGSNFFNYYNNLSFISKKNISALSTLIHNNNTTVFFENMVMYCHNKNTLKYVFDNINFYNICVTYVYGFLSHYVLDTYAHPYIYSLQQSLKNKYKHKRSIALYKSIETHLDTLILFKFKNLKPYEFKDYLNMSLNKEELLIICDLYNYLLNFVYDKKISHDDIKKSYYTFKNVERKINSSPNLISRIYLNIKSATVKNSFIDNEIYSDYTHCVNDLFNEAHNIWIDPFTDKKYNYSFLDIYSNSLNIFLELSKELNLYFNNESTINSLLLKINK